MEDAEKAVKKYMMPFFSNHGNGDAVFAYHVRERDNTLSITDPKGRHKKCLRSEIPVVSPLTEDERETWYV